MDLFRIGEGAGRLVDDKATVFPTVPELPRDVDQFDQPRIGVRAGRRQIEALEARGKFAGSREARDPADAAAREMVERREHAGHMIRLGDIGRPIGAEADMLGGGDHCAQQRQWIEVQAVDPVRTLRHRHRRQPQQDRVQAATLGCLRHRAKRRRAIEACFARHPPGGGMPAMGGQRSHEMHVIALPACNS